MTDGNEGWGDDDYWRSRWVEDDLAPDWVTPLNTDRIDIDWTSDGGDWLHCVGEAISDSGGASWTARNRGGTRRHPGTIFSPNRDKTCIWCCLIDGKLRIELWGLGVREDALIRRWQNAIDSATAAFQSAPLREWVAAIDSDDPYGAQQKLARNGSVCELGLESVNEPTISRERSRRSFNSATIHTSYPIVVRGMARSNSLEFDYRAGVDLRYLCALLTLAWDSHWTMAERPVAPDSWHGVSSRLPWDEVRLEKDDLNTLGSPEHVYLEPWMSSAITIGKGNPSLLRALLMYDEAVSLQYDHPSVSLVCTTSAVEAIAESRLGPLDRCSACRQFKGSTRRFETLLCEVVSCEESKRLAAAYSSRSTTVHAAELHQGERAFNDFLADFHLADSSGNFWQMRLKLNRACRRLLLREFGAPGETSEVD